MLGVAYPAGGGGGDWMPEKSQARRMKPKCLQSAGGQVWTSVGAQNPRGSPTQRLFCTDLAGCSPASSGQVKA